jgi:hypothetical protein
MIRVKKLPQRASLGEAKIGLLWICCEEKLRAETPENRRFQTFLRTATLLLYFPFFRMYQFHFPDQVTRSRIFINNE